MWRDEYCLRKCWPSRRRIHRVRNDEGRFTARGGLGSKKESGNHEHQCEPYPHPHRVCARFACRGRIVKIGVTNLGGVVPAAEAGVPP